MVHFKVDYDLSYYDSRSYRLIINHDSQTIRLMNSYSTTLFVLNFGDFISYEEYDVEIGCEKLEVKRIGLLSGEVFTFFSDKNAYNKIKNMICEGIAKTEDNRSVDFINNLQRLIEQKKAINYVIQISSSRYDKCMKDIQEICTNNKATS